MIWAVSIWLFCAGVEEIAGLFHIAAGERGDAAGARPLPHGIRFGEGQSGLGLIGFRV